MHVLMSLAGLLGVLCAGTHSILAQAPTAQTSLNHSLMARACASSASLNSLAVVSADQLCAVGDCGVILLTDDSGRSWEQIESPCTANLHSVAFLDAEHGVAVGGEIGGYTRTSSAVILRTTNGGKTWDLVANDLPRLVGLAIHDMVLTAWGDFSPQFGSGLFQSLDFGASWQPMRSSLGHVLAHARSRAGVSQSVDTLGRAQISNAINAPAQSIGRPDARIQCLHHSGDSWLAAGEHGELIQSQDGIVWSNVALPLSAAARQVCHWRSISQVANEIWVAGFPGSILLYSRDRGVSWAVRPTGQTLPISQVQFLDQHRGWTVGPFGCILATRDGGATWHAQRQVLSRVGVLSVVAAAEQIPWSPLVASVWDDRIAAKSLVIGPSDPVDEASFLPSQAAQLKEIAPQLGFTLELHQSANPSTEQLANELAAELLTWRPNVVLTHEAAGVGQQKNRSGAPQLTTVLLSAVELARGLKTPGAIAQELALQPWSVDKLVTVTQAERLQYSEQSQRVMKSLGLAIWDVLLSLPPEQRDQAASTALRTQWTSSHNRAASVSLLGGVAPSADTAHKFVTQGIGNYQLVMGRVHRQKSMEQLVNSSDSDAIWERDLKFILDTIPNQELVPVLWDLSKKINFSQHRIRHAKALEQMVARAPGSDGAKWAMLELLRLDGSDEAAAWLQAQSRKEPVPIEFANQIYKARETPGVNTLSDWSAKSWNQTPFSSQEEDAATSAAVVPASASKVIPGSNERPSHGTAMDIQQKEQRWFELLSRFSQLEPDLMFRPDLQMMTHRRASIRLLAQGSLRVEDRLESMLAINQLLGWPQVAQQEIRLGISQLEDSRWVALAARAELRPQLDGQLNEASWHAVPPMRLTNFSETSDATTMRWAYDDRYLYLALECPTDAKETRPSLGRLRSYDSDLQGTDHVEVLIDTDRDYCSAIELAISQDGRTYDRCCGRADYDPKWHVLVQNNARSWNAEIAIELKYLTTNPNLVGSAWAISARRIRPDESTQSWSQLRTHQPLLESSGLLLFVPGDALGESITRPPDAN